MILAVTDEVEMTVVLPVVHRGPNFPPKCDRVHIDVVDATGRTRGPHGPCSSPEYFPSGRLLWVGEYGRIYRGDETGVIDKVFAYTDHAYLVGRRVGREGDPEVGHDGIGCAQVIVLVDVGVLDALTDTANRVTSTHVNNVVVEAEIFVVIVTKREIGPREHGLDDVAHLDVAEELVYIGEMTPSERDEFRID